MNKTHDYLTLEREFITGDMSIRELVRRHGFRNASVVHVQAKAQDWYGKRGAYRRQAQAKTMARLADSAARRAERELEVRDHALETIDAAFGAMEAQLQQTRRVQRDGEMVEEPLVRVTPKDFAILLDCVQKLERPAQIVEQRSLEVSVQSTEINVQQLARLAEFTRPRARGLSASGGTADDGR